MSTPTGKGGYRATPDDLKALSDALDDIRSACARFTTSEHTMSAYFTTGVQIALLDDRPQVSQVPHDGWAALSRRFSEWSARSAAEHETMTQTVEKAAQGARSAAASYVADDHNTAGTFAALSTSHNDPRGTAWA